MILRSPALPVKTRSKSSIISPTSSTINRPPLHLIQESNFSTLARSRKVGKLCIMAFLSRFSPVCLDQLDTYFPEIYFSYIFVEHFTVLFSSIIFDAPLIIIIVLFYSDRVTCLFNPLGDL